MGREAHRPGEASLRQAQDKMIWQRVLAGPVKNWMFWEGFLKEENLCCVETVPRG